MSILTTLIIYGLAQLPVAHARATAYLPDILDDDAVVGSVVDDGPSATAVAKPAIRPPKANPVRTARTKPASTPAPVETAVAKPAPKAQRPPAPVTASRAAPTAAPAPTTARAVTKSEPPPAPPAPKAKPEPKPEPKPEVRAMPEKIVDKTPPPKPKFTCSGRTSEIKELNARSIDTEVFEITWSEDTPVVGGKARFRLFDRNGDAQIEMINSSGESVGVSPAKVCLVEADGQKALRVSLQMSTLNLGFFAGSKIRGALMTRYKDDKVLPLIVTRVDGRKIRIEDDVDKTMIRSNFTAVGANR